MAYSNPRPVHLSIEDRRGFHPAITRAISLAFAPSVIPGNSRRNSLPADNSPSCSKAVLIAAASASDTQNIAYILAQIATCRASASYPVVPARVRKSIGDDPDSTAEPLPATIHYRLFGGLRQSFPCICRAAKILRLRKVFTALFPLSTALAD
jgi:hypothetical protein